MHYLIITTSGKDPVKYTLSQYPVTIGRARTNMVVISDAKVSRFHATLAYANESWLLSDLKTLNGTAVQGKRISQATLKTSDSFILGTHTLTIISDITLDQTIAFSTASFETAQPPLIEPVDVPNEQSPFADFSIPIESSASSRETILFKAIVQPSENSTVTDYGPLHDDQILILKLTGTLSAQTSKTFTDAITYFKNGKTKRVILDATAVSSITSGGWEEIVTATSAFKEHQGIVKIAGLQAHIIKSFKEMVIGTSIQHQPTVEAAILSFEQ